MQEMNMVEVETVSGGMGSRGTYISGNSCDNAVMGGFIGGAIAGLAGGLAGVVSGAIGGAAAGYITSCKMR